MLPRGDERLHVVRVRVDLVGAEHAVPVFARDRRVDLEHVAEPEIRLDLVLRAVQIVQ
jgi:hypothetical protein